MSAISFLPALNKPNSAVEDDDYACLIRHDTACILGQTSTVENGGEGRDRFCGRRRRRFVTAPRAGTSTKGMEGRSAGESSTGA